MSLEGEFCNFSQSKSFGEVSLGTFYFVWKEDPGGNMVEKIRQF